MGALSCAEWLAWGLLIGSALVVPEMPTHTPIVIAAKAGIQYAAAHRSDRWRLWNTGSSAFADDDSRWMTRLHDLAA
ncbi:hypothetical protein V1283_007342 [Bradyrhizobium sp. AZCC 2262]